MPNLAVKASTAGSVSPCFRPEDNPDEMRNGDVNACFHPDHDDLVAGLHLTLTGVEEQHLAALAVR